MTAHEQIASLSPLQDASLTQHQPEALHPQMLAPLSMMQIMALPLRTDASASADQVQSCGRMAYEDFELPTLGQQQIGLLTVAQIEAMTIH